MSSAANAIFLFSMCLIRDSSSITPPRAAAWVTHPICDAFGITTENLNVFLYWTLRIILITVVYKFILVFVAFIFGEFTFFWNFIKKFLARMGVRF